MIIRPEDWDDLDLPNFTFAECADRQGHGLDADIRFLQLLQTVRNELAGPLRISSLYRSPLHKIEASKDRPGSHSHGCAVDILCHTVTAHRLLAILDGRFTGIGISQHGPMSSRFLHLDSIEPGKIEHIHRPSVWSYG